MNARYDWLESWKLIWVFFQRVYSTLVDSMIFRYTAFMHKEEKYEEMRCIFPRIVIQNHIFIFQLSELCALCRDVQIIETEKEHHLVDIKTAAKQLNAVNANKIDTYRCDTHDLNANRRTAQSYHLLEQTSRYQSIIALNCKFNAFSITMPYAMCTSMIVHNNT